jgi:hypothetical protein
MSMDSSKGLLRESGDLPAVYLDYLKNAEYGKGCMEVNCLQQATIRVAGWLAPSPCLRAGLPGPRIVAPRVSKGKKSSNFFTDPLANGRNQVVKDLMCVSWIS